jgi:hypothetical protein
MGSELPDSELAKKIKLIIAFTDKGKFSSSVRLSNHEVIIDTKRFFLSHISTIRTYWKNPQLRQPYLDRLFAAYEILKKSKKT